MLGVAGDDEHKQTIAFTYWMAVRLFGAFCFHYSDHERDEFDLEREREKYYDRNLRRNKEEVSYISS